MAVRYLLEPISQQTSRFITAQALQIGAGTRELIITPVMIDRTLLLVSQGPGGGGGGGGNNTSGGGGGGGGGRAVSQSLIVPAMVGAVITLTCGAFGLGAASTLAKQGLNGTDATDSIISINNNFFEPLVGGGGKAGRGALAGVTLSIPGLGGTASGGNISNLSGGNGGDGVANGWVVNGTDGVTGGGGGGGSKIGSVLRAGAPGIGENGSRNLTPPLITRPFRSSGGGFGGNRDGANNGQPGWPGALYGGGGGGGGGSNSGSSRYRGAGGGKGAEGYAFVAVY